MMPYLTQASSQMEPRDRLAEAAANPWYAISDLRGEFEDMSDYISYFRATTVHEAGHAVAMTLVEDPVSYLTFSPPYTFVRGKAGSCVSATDRRKYETTQDLVHGLGPAGVARQVLVCFAGPVAELRYDFSRVHSGNRQDMQDAESLSKVASFEGLIERFEVFDGAWAEACRLFQDDRVWSATIEIADRLWGSRATRPRVAGGAVRKIVERHLPDGWQWRGIFSPQDSPSPPILRLPVDGRGRPIGDAGLSA